jgi:ureidoglycolate lyase
MIIRALPLTATAFLPFGQVLETRGDEAEWINRGHTQKFAQLADIQFIEGGQTNLSIYRSHPVELPFRIEEMERHPLGSQAFFPLHQRPFPIVVSNTSGVPAGNEIKAFISNGKQGVNIAHGIWHHYQLTLDQISDYLVIDRQGDGDNYQDCRLDEEVLLQI